MAQVRKFAAEMPGSSALPGAVPLRPSVKVEGVSHIFKGKGDVADVVAVQDIDFELTHGEFFSIVGPSGCGKSTLLDIIAGLTSPTHGRVFFQGKEVGRRVPDGVGMVFQEDASFPWLSVKNNVSYGLRLKGVDAAEIKRRVDYALGLVGLTAFCDHYPSQLSGGMRQRVCIARTLVMMPKLILMDEPFGALDQQTRLLMGEELLRVWKEADATVILITHALDEAAMLSDRIGVMSARPGHFIDFVQTGWPRDRDSTVVSDERFGELTARLWMHLRGESQKSMGTALGQS